ncbi:hypothetical protein GQ44DRAFT_830992 [Phaeosphaeriaceae sp. PMI808]|nr:hypothetical protein GQ44DRAFT_830992 [Phaeosphaeriaceae sp. PMI808]
MPSRKLTINHVGKYVFPSFANPALAPLRSFPVAPPKISATNSSTYWEYLWREEGQRLFASACVTANLEQLEIVLGAKRADDHVVRPSKSEISCELVGASHRGHYEVVERLLQEKADVNAAAAGGESGRTALQAAAEGGHLAVVECLRGAGAIK